MPKRSDAPVVGTLRLSAVFSKNFMASTYPLMNRRSSFLPMNQ